MKPPYTSAIRTIYGPRPRQSIYLDRPGRSRKVWWISLVLFLLCLAVGASFYFFGQTPPVFTGDRVAIELSGADEPEVGVPQDYILRVTNNEEVELDNFELFIDFNRSNRPEQTGEATSTDSSIVPISLITADPEPNTDGRNTWKLGKLSIGQTSEIKLSLNFLGQSGKELALPMLATFKPAGLGSDFTTRFEKKFKLGSAAIAVVIDGPDKAASGGEVAFSIAIPKPEDNNSSSSAEAQFNPEDWFLELKLPSEFSIIDFDPKPADSSSAWTLAALPIENNLRVLSVRGKFDAKAGSEIILSALLTNKKISGLRVSAEKKVIIKNTELEFTLQAAPDQGKKLQWGEKTLWSLSVKNNGQEPLGKAIVSVALSGDNMWQAGTLAISNNGVFEGGNIIWDEKSDKRLADIEPGKKIDLTFSFVAAKEPPALIASSAILASGKFSASSGNETVETRSGEVEIKVLADIDLSAEASRPQQEGSSSGMHPPLPGQETIYPVQWSVGPSTNELADLRVFTTLPKDVMWKNAGPVASGELTYEATSRTVVWKLAKSEKITAPLSIVFFVGITPRQEATNSLVIIESSTLTATDPLAQDNFELYAPAVLLGDVK